jgi:hypothetical protein
VAENVQAARQHRDQPVCFLVWGLRTLISRAVPKNGFANTGESGLGPGNAIAFAVSNFHPFFVHITFIVLSNALQHSISASEFSPSR